MCVTRIAKHKPGRWGNPFRVGDGGIATAADAVLAYRLWLVDQPVLIARIRAELAGKILLCWCKVGAPCHGDVLAEVANTPAWGEPVPTGVDAIDTDLLLAALRRGAADEDERDALALFEGYAADYLDWGAVRSLIEALSAPAVPLARIGWEAVAAQLMTGAFAVPDHVGALWAVACDIATGVEIDVDLALWNLDCRIAPRVQELVWRRR